MTKVALSEVAGGTEQVKQPRKSLRTLQVSANDLDIVEKENMVHKPGKESVIKSKAAKGTIKTDLVTEKENAPTVRRSKRRNVASSSVSKDPNLTETTRKNAKVKSEKPSSKSKKGHSSGMKKAEQNANLTQSKLNFSQVPSPSTSVKLETVPKCDEPKPSKPAAEISEAQMTEDKANDAQNDTFTLGICNLEQSCQNEFNTPLESNVTVLDDDSIMITAQTPPLKYWKDIAEQRRIALEKALHENELLYDQLEVLETENSQLKSIIKEAEALATVVKDVLG